MRRIIFASHGSLCEGMKDSIAMIAGPLADKIETHSLHPGENPQDLYEDLKEQIQKSKDDFVILCDVLGGSVHTALSQLTQFENAVVYSGMNMGMGLELVTAPEDAEVSDEILQHLVQSGRQGITLLQGAIAATADEDF